MIRVTFDASDDEPFQDDGFQPSLFGGPGAQSILKQPALFAGALDRGEQRQEKPRADQPDLFAPPEEPLPEMPEIPDNERTGMCCEPDIPRRYTRETMRRVARSPLR
jgi:hypothetical protein